MFRAQMHEDPKYASRDGLDGLLRYQPFVDHFFNRKPFHINVPLHNCLMLILFSQIKKAFLDILEAVVASHTRSHDLPPLQFNLETWKPTNWSHVAPSNPHQKKGVVPAISRVPSCFQGENTHVYPMKLVQWDWSCDGIIAVCSSLCSSLNPPSKCYICYILRADPIFLAVGDMTPCCETPILVLPGMIQLNSFGFKLVYSYRIIKTINSIFSIFSINLTVSQDIFTNLATSYRLGTQLLEQGHEHDARDRKSVV